MLEVERKRFSVGRYFLMSEMFTRVEKKRKTCVHYALPTPVYQNIANLQRIVRGELEEFGLRKKLVAQLNAAGNFLKFPYCAHIARDNEILNFPRKSFRSFCTNDDTFTNARDCMEFLKPFQVLQDLKTAATAIA